MAKVEYSLTLLEHIVHVGHITALSYQGYDYYLKFGSTERIRLYSKQKLPSWIEKVKIGPNFVTMKRNPFFDESIGVIDIPFGTWDWPIPFSTPERVFIE